MTTAAIFQEPSSPQVPPAEAATDPDAPTPDAPYGWRTDPDTGLRVAKKTAGRRPKAAAPAAAANGVSPSLEELKARGAPSGRREDVAPAEGARTRAPLFAPGVLGPKAPEKEEPVPPFRAGPIAKGVNRLYRRAGKIIRIWDHALGSAIIACTRKDADDEDDEDRLTVGEAWEELARVNPKIRVILLKALSGGAVTAVVMAHGPLLLALMLKDSVRRFIPFGKLLAALAEEDEDGQEQPWSMQMGGLDISGLDMAQMMGMMQGMMAGGMMPDMPRGMNETRDPGPGEQAA